MLSPPALDIHNYPSVSPPLSFLPRNRGCFFGPNFTRSRVTILAGRDCFEGITSASRVQIVSKSDGFGFGWTVNGEMWRARQLFRKGISKEKDFQPLRVFSPRIFKKVHRETLHACPCTREDRGEPPLQIIVSCVFSINPRLSNLRAASSLANQI